MKLQISCNISAGSASYHGHRVPCAILPGIRRQSASLLAPLFQRRHVQRTTLQLMTTLLSPLIDRVQADVLCEHAVISPRT